MVENVREKNHSSCGYRSPTRVYAGSGVRPAVQGFIGDIQRNTNEGKS